MSRAEAATRCALPSARSRRRTTGSRGRARRCAGRRIDPRGSRWPFTGPCASTPEDDVPVTRARRTAAATRRVNAVRRLAVLVWLLMDSSEADCTAERALRDLGKTDRRANDTWRSDSRAKSNALAFLARSHDCTATERNHRLIFRACVRLDGTASVQRLYLNPSKRLAKNGPHADCLGPCVSVLPASVHPRPLNLARTRGQHPRRCRRARSPWPRRSTRRWSSATRGWPRRQATA
jgi:hypothetical protein